ncbi:hypothetical protein BGAL_0236g00140 [Botrytis galanthina]|uniref:Uncharacterized protein n=1 Tax=Botrytis galanthina TaxID=278940 RepID=A0A4S8R613_9HELO|nr:hypothetical protein BGAL_0236g00140 [Botrytis galanthina]
MTESPEALKKKEEEENEENDATLGQQQQQQQQQQHQEAECIQLNKGQESKRLPSPQTDPSFL